MSSVYKRMWVSRKQCTDIASEDVSIHFQLVHLANDSLPAVTAASGEPDAPRVSCRGQCTRNKAHGEHEEEKAGDAGE